MCCLSTKKNPICNMGLLDGLTKKLRTGFTLLFVNNLFNFKGSDTEFLLTTTNKVIAKYQDLFELKKNPKMLDTPKRYIHDIEKLLSKKNLSIPPRPPYCWCYCLLVWFCLKFLRSD
jgi:hypothetical protein